MLLLLLACTDPATDSAPAVDDSKLTTPVDDSATPTDVPLARWTFMVFMDGDNDLELYVPTDLDEIEQTGSGDDVHVLVQADRIPGYVSGDGDWTGTRRYYMEHHPEPGVQTPMLEDLGELDMGDPQTLTDFMMWSVENYPAERYVLVMWNHGDLWTMAPDDLTGVAPPSISSDDTSGNMMSLAQGEFQAGLQPFVDQEGPIDVLVFDACSMANWEVAHTLAPYADWMSASETYVGAEGVSYPEALALIREDVTATPQALAEELTVRAVEQGLEDTWAAFDMSHIAPLSAAMDNFAAAVIADPSLFEAVIAARDAAGSTDPSYPATYLDLGDFITRAGEIPSLEAPAADILTAMDTALVVFRSEPRWDWTHGYTVFADLNAQALNVYTSGAGATWAHQTRWDEMLIAMYDAGLR